MMISSVRFTPPAFASQVRRPVVSTPTAAPRFGNDSVPPTYFLLIPEEKRDDLLRKLGFLNGTQYLSNIQKNGYSIYLHVHNDNINQFTVNSSNQDHKAAFDAELRQALQAVGLEYDDVKEKK